MLAGHYATALVADQHTPRKALFFFLVASQLPDLLWLVFALAGLEPTRPENVLDVSLQNLTVNMTYSHDLLPMVGWVAILYAIGLFAFKSHKVGIIAGLLFLVHDLTDYAAGYPHHIFGPETASVGFAAYKTVPLVAVAFEAVFTVICLALFFRTERSRGIHRTRGNAAAIVGLFVFNLVFMVTIATTSFRERLGLPEIDSPLLGSVPSLMVTYWAMLFYLFYFVRKTTPSPTGA